MKICYIHGYGSNGLRTGGKLKEAVGVDVEILGWDSDKPFRENFNDLLKRVKEIAKKDDEIVLVATSLGCCYARAIAENEYCELNLFNSCFKPWELTNIIPPEISKTYDYEFNKSIGIAMAIFVSSEDEVIPNNVESVKEMFGGRCYIEVTKEKHRIESFEKYKDKILDTSFFLRNDMLSVDKIINQYEKTWTILDSYDKESFEMAFGKSEQELSYGFVLDAISKFKAKLLEKGEASKLFGVERNSELEGIIKGIYQTFDGEPLYKSCEEKALNLMYNILKNHLFIDGNKRIGAFLFLLFLDKNNALYDHGGNIKIKQKTLALFAILITSSDIKQKELVIKLGLSLMKN